ncbi:unnamed protein product [Victoria cruziana]
MHRRPFGRLQGELQKRIGALCYNGNGLAGQIESIQVIPFVLFCRPCRGSKVEVSFCVAQLKVKSKSKLESS